MPIEAPLTRSGDSSTNADHVLLPRALLRLVHPLLSAPQPRIYVAAKSRLELYRPLPPGRSDCAVWPKHRRPTTEPAQRRWCTVRAAPIAGGVHCQSQKAPVAFTWERLPLQSASKLHRMHDTDYYSGATLQPSAPTQRLELPNPCYSATAMDRGEQDRATTHSGSNRTSRFTPMHR
jgi:hypothetical protein